MPGRHTALVNPRSPAWGVCGHPLGKAGALAARAAAAVVVVPRRLPALCCFPPRFASRPFCVYAILAGVSPCLFILLALFPCSSFLAFISGHLVLLSPACSFSPDSRPVATFLTGDRNAHGRPRGSCTRGQHVPRMCAQDERMRSRWLVCRCKESPQWFLSFLNRTCI